MKKAILCLVLCCPALGTSGQCNQPAGYLFPVPLISQDDGLWKLSEATGGLIFVDVNNGQIVRVGAADFGRVPSEENMAETGGALVMNFVVVSIWLGSEANLQFNIVAERQFDGGYIGTANVTRIASGSSTNYAIVLTREGNFFIP